MCRHTKAMHTDLPSDLGAAGLARALVRQALCQPHAAHLAQAVQLITSELVTNAVRHGRAPISMSLDCVFGQGVVLAVSDTGPTLPTARPAPPGAEGGRGIHLIEMLSSRWGVVQDAATGTHTSRKKVWTVIDPERTGPL